MIGPKTYRALWQEHINLVHETWQKSAEGDHPAALDRVFDSPLPPDLRAEMTKLDEAYAGYWSAVEGRYQAILRRDPVLVAEYDRELTLARGAGLKVDEIGVLQAEYQPLIDALNKQAETVKNTRDDGEYAKLQAMLAAADAGKWEEIRSVQATWGGRWDAFWNSDSSEVEKAEQVIVHLEPYASEDITAVAGKRGASLSISISSSTTTMLQTQEQPRHSSGQLSTPDLDYITLLLNGTGNTLEDLGDLDS